MAPEPTAIRLRRATASDVEFLAELVADPEVEPFLAPISARTPHEFGEEITRSEHEPRHHGRLVIECDLVGSTERAGSVAYEIENRRSRIAYAYGLAVAPRYRGHGIGVEAFRLLIRLLIGELDYHRVQVEIYGFNERAVRLAERAGFIREGIRRKAYWRNETWIDGVMFGLVAEDLEASDRGQP